MTETATAPAKIDTCPGCGEDLVNSDELGDVVTFDSARVHGEWHEVCGDEAKDGVL